MSTSASPRRQGAQKKKAVKKKRRKVSFLRKLARGFMFCLLLLTIGMGWLYFAPSALNFRYLIADTLITTQHRYMAKYIIGEEELKNRVAEYNQRFIHMGDEVDTHTITAPVTEAAAEAAEVKDEKPLVEIEQVSGSGYSGYVMTVNDPTKVRLGIPDKAGSGEKVSSMVARTGAIAGVNGGGFADPEWKGNGFKPIGLVISQGKLFITGLAERRPHRLWGSTNRAK